MHTKDKKTIKKFYFSRVVTAVVVAMTVATYPTITARADTYDDQIQALQREVNRYQDEAGKLRTQANTLQNAINELTAKQNALQAQISQKEVELQQIKKQIADTEVRIDNQKKALARNLKSVYIESDVSPLEMVASSKSIGDFIDKQEYRNKIRDGIQEALAEIKKLKAELEQKKTAAEHVLEDQKNISKQVAAQEAAKSQLLTETQGKEDAYQNLVSQKSGEIESLRAQQKAANLNAYGGNIDFSKTSSYPWPNASMDYSDACYYADGTSGADPWGYCFRQCTSFVAWKLAKDGKSGFSSLGNAGGWVAGGSWVSTQGAEHGDVLVWQIGYYGHVMYIEGRTADGLMVSEFNFDWTGRYSERFLSWNELGGSYSVRRF